MQGDALRQSAEAHKGNISAWWDSVERSWNDHLAAVRKDFDDKRAAHDLKSAQRRADNAEDDASFAVDYTYAAVDEADMRCSTPPSPAWRPTRWQRLVAAGPADAGPSPRSRIIDGFLDTATRPSLAAAQLKEWLRPRRWWL